MSSTDNWKLVPVSPTDAMLKKGEIAYWQKARDMSSPTPTEEPWIGAAGYCYLAMLAAAPQPPQETPIGRAAGADIAMSNDLCSLRGKLIASQRCNPNAVPWLIQEALDIVDGLIAKGL